MSDEPKFEKEMTEEEMTKMIEQRNAEWVAFMKDLKDNPNSPITAQNLEKVINYMSDDIGGLAQMVQSVAHNMAVLNNNFNNIMKVIQGGAQNPGVNKTKSGIILP